MKKTVVLSLFLFLASVAASAGTITFDDLTTRNNFDALGISNTYQGFIWTSSGGTGSGWASATVSDPAVAPAPTPVSGESYAWNWGGTQSLYITFPTPYAVTGAYFATLSPGFSSNASSVQMFGYDASNNLIATSSSLNLADSFQLLNANFTNVSKLEIRANAALWFSVDNIELGASATPEPSTLSMIAFPALLLGFGFRRRQARPLPTTPRP